MAVSEKRMTFNREFREARKSFEDNPTEKNYTFTSKVDGGKKTILKKGETKQGLMKKFKSKSGANYKVKGAAKVRPKLRPKSATQGEKTAAQIAAQELVYKKSGGKRKVTTGMNPIVAPDGQDIGKDYYSFPQDISGYSRKEMLKIIDEGKTPRRGIGASSFAGRGKGTDKKSEPKAKVSATQKPSSIKKLEAFKAGTLKLNQRLAFRLIKTLKDYNEKNPKNKVTIPKKLLDLGGM